jgi:hypothetical protein
MSTLNISPQPAAQQPIRCRQPEVYVNGERRRDLAVTEWRLAGCPDFASLTLTVAGAGGAYGPPRFGSADVLPPIDAEVRVLDAAGACGFTGRVVAHHLSVGEQEELLTAECRDVLAGAFSGEITGHWRAEAGQAAEIAQSPPRFNFGSTGLASAAPAAVRGRQCRVFDAGPDAVRWSVADALLYLLVAHGPAGMELPDADELESLAWQVDLGDLDAAGKTAGQVIRQCLDRGGLGMRPGRDGGSVIVYRAGVSGRGRNVRLQPSGEALDTAGTNLWRGQISVTRRPARPGVLVLGGRKRYESTFAMRPGWDPSDATGRWRDFVRGLAANWPAVAAVYRTWVLNEHGRYSGSPWNLPLHSFADISEEDFLSTSPRPFRPCLSCDETGQSLGVVVEYRRDDESPWRRWPAEAWAAADQCAVYLGGDGLPGDYFRAAVAETVELRVTASVDADRRIAFELPGRAGAGQEVIDAAQAGWRKVHSSSVLAGASGLGQADECDDSGVLRRIAAQRSRQAGLATAAELTLGWIDTSYQVGDFVDKIDGREFHLSSDADRRAFITSVVHDFGETQTTHLTVRG